MAELPMPELVERDGSGIFFMTDDAMFDATGTRIAFTGRLGGVSAAPYDSLNLGSHVGDDAAAVAENRRRALAALGVPDECRLVTLNQVHGTCVLEIGANAGESDVAHTVESAKDGADGIAVASPDVAALLCFADCVPLVLALPDGAFAVVHAGWRGVMSGIAAEAVSRLLAGSPGASAAGMNAYIGPHIHSECFEVSEGLAFDFAAKFGGDVGPSSRHVDLSRALSKTLVKAGLSPERIVDAGKCTVCNAEEFFSYRASGGQCGRHGAIAFRRR